jgi:hypothetical protein
MLASGTWVAGIFGADISITAISGGLHASNKWIAIIKSAGIAVFAINGSPYTWWRRIADIGGAFIIIITVFVIGACYSGSQSVPWENSKKEKTKNKEKP